MFEIWILICAVGLSLVDCRGATALGIFRGSPAANEVVCGREDQVLLAQATRGQRRVGVHAKLPCARSAPHQPAIAGTPERTSDKTEGGPSPRGHVPPYPEMDPLQHETLRPFHDVIASWKDKDGTSCCNEQDCRVVKDYVVRLDAATGKETYSVRIFDRWWAVPSAALRPYTSPTYGVIACYTWFWDADDLPRPVFKCVVGPHNS